MLPATLGTKMRLIWQPSLPRDQPIKLAVEKGPRSPIVCWFWTKISMSIEWGYYKEPSNQPGYFSIHHHGIQKSLWDFLVFFSGDLVRSFCGFHGWPLLLWKVHIFIFRMVMCIYNIWANYNISLTWIKAIWGWSPLRTMISSDVAVRSL